MVHFVRYIQQRKMISTLSSVQHTPIGQYENSKEALNDIKNIGKEKIEAKKSAMEAQLTKYYPSFLDEYEYTEPQLCVKTKPRGQDDDRSCYVKKYGRVIKCLSGKIDNIFYAASEVLAMIEGNEI